MMLLDALAGLLTAVIAVALLWAFAGIWSPRERSSQQTEVPQSGILVVKRPPTGL